MTSELITRLSTLDAPDREVDWEIQQFFMGEWLQKNGYRREGDHYRTFTPPLSGTEICSGPEHYTFSVDAAIALAEKVLPGWYWGITQGDDGEDAMEFQGNVWPSIQPYPAELEQYGYHKFPAIALLIALLRAKEASKL